MMYRKNILRLEDREHPEGELDVDPHLQGGIGEVQFSDSEEVTK